MVNTTNDKERRVNFLAYSVFQTPAGIMRHVFSTVRNHNCNSKHNDIILCITCNHSESAMHKCSTLKVETHLQPIDSHYRYIEIHINTFFVRKKTYIEVYYFIRKRKTVIVINIQIYFHSTQKNKQKNKRIFFSNYLLWDP